MLEVFDKTRKKIAILENAFEIREEQRINAVWRFQFSLPLKDPKNKCCRPFYFVRCNGGELYRIMPCTRRNGPGGFCQYQCEHVLAVLLDTVLQGSHIVGNLGTYTADCIRYILNKQPVGNWELEACDFTNQYEYGWEHENLLSALFSIAAPLTDSYMWTWNTASYPWKLSLKRLEDGKPELFIREKYNLLHYEDTSDTQQICTRLYPYGYGEGVNQLNIRKVNNGLPYIESPPDIVEKYGVIERIWIDRRYENEESLLAAARNMLKELQEPLISRTVSFAELSRQDQDQAALGKRVRLIVPELDEQTDTRITAVTWHYDDLPSSEIIIANRDVDIAASVADLADRIRIESAYSQGATQLYGQALQGNADSGNGLVMRFYIPPEMRIVNHVKCKVSIGRFRAYSQAAAAGGGTSVSSSSGGSTSTTTSSGGGGGNTSDSNGGGSYTSSSGGGTVTVTGGGGANVVPEIYMYIPKNFLYINNADGSKGSHSHTHSDNQLVFPQRDLPSHTHQMNIPSHTHYFNMPSHSHYFYTNSHSHTVTISSHTHTVTTPNHTHSITPGIYFFGNPKSFGVYVNGVLKQTIVSSSEELDLTNWLVRNGSIPRGQWHTLEIRPNDLAYISIDMFVQGFVQSRGDAAL